MWASVWTVHATTWGTDLGRELESQGFSVDFSIFLFSNRATFLDIFVPATLARSLTGSKLPPSGSGESGICYLKKLNINIDKAQM